MPRIQKLFQFLFQQQVTVEEISVQRMRKLAKQEPVYLAVVRTMKKSKELANEAIVTVNEDKTKTPYPVQVQTLLTEFSDVFPKDLPAELPPLRQLEHP